MRGGYFILMFYPIILAGLEHPHRRGFDPHQGHLFLRRGGVRCGGVRCGVVVWWRGGVVAWWRGVV